MSGQEADHEMLAPQPFGPEEAEQQILPERGLVGAAPLDRGEARRVGVNAPGHVPGCLGQTIPRAELQEQRAHPGLLEEFDANSDASLDPAAERARPTRCVARARCGRPAVGARVNGRHVAGTAHTHGPAVVAPMLDFAMPATDAASRVGRCPPARLTHQIFATGCAAEPARRTAAFRTGHELMEVWGTGRTDRAAAHDPARLAREGAVTAQTRPI